MSKKGKKFIPDNIELLIKMLLWQRHTYQSLLSGGGSNRKEEMWLPQYICSLTHPSIHSFTGLMCFALCHVQCDMKGARILVLVLKDPLSA